jgi:hypothetical protein
MTPFDEDCDVGHIAEDHGFIVERRESVERRRTYGGLFEYRLIVSGSGKVTNGARNMKHVGP